MQIYLREKWTPDLSLVDLFEHADAYEAKKAFFPNMCTTAVMAVEKTSPVEISAVKGKKAKDSKSQDKQISSVGDTSDLEKVMEKMLRSTCLKQGTPNLIHILKIRIRIRNRPVDVA